MRDKETGLTGKQTAFVEEYCINGQNGRQAAIKAKYGGKYCTNNYLDQIAHKLVSNDKVRAEINKKLSELQTKSIANRQQRQQFWTSVINNALIGIKTTMGDRLKASELLGRSQADFTDNINQTDTQRQRELDEKEQQEAQEIAKERLKVFGRTG